MAYVALMMAFGYEGKIQQSGIHTWSVLWCPLKKTDGARVVLAARVDNTFDSLHWEAAPMGLTWSEWLADIGSGSEVRRYVNVARSKDQATSLGAGEVPDAARERIREQVRAALHGMGR